MDYESLTVNGTKNMMSSFSDKNETKFSEWQIAIGLAAKVGSFVPYGGIKYSDINLSSDVTIGSNRYKIKDEAQNNFGFFLGCGWFFDDIMQLSAEMRFADEQAYSIKAGYSF